MDEELEKYKDLVITSDFETGEGDEEEKDDKDDEDIEVEEKLKDKKMADADVDDLVMEARSRLGVLAEESAESENDTDMPAELRVLTEYIPERDDIGSKGSIPNIDLANMISVVRLYPELFPEIKRDKEVWNLYLDELEKRLTSVEGKSREEFQRIYEALLSGVSYKHEDEGWTLGEKLFGTGDEPDEQQR